MRKVLFILCLLVSSLSYGQIRYNQMPDLDSLAGGDYVPVFRPPYDQGKATFSTLIGFIRDSVSAGNAVDSIWRVPGKDSIFFRKSGTTYKIKDSTGTGGGATWGTITGALEDQADLYDTLFNRVRYADTASMLSKYLRKTDTASLSNRINLKLNASDTSSLSSRINLKLSGSDTASLIARINAKMDSATAFTDYSSTSTIAGFSSFTTKQIQYLRHGKLLYVQIDLRCASPNSSGTTTTFTIPFNASSWSGEQRGIIHGVNGTTQGACLWKVAAGSNIIEVAIGANDTAFSSWTNGTARRILGTLIINVP